jgi:purine-binding chemotaxis protein CheW
MSAKENQDTLLGYFNELLGDNSVSQNSSEDSEPEKFQIKEAASIKPLGESTSISPTKTSAANSKNSISASLSINSINISPTNLENKTNATAEVSAELPTKNSETKLSSPFNQEQVKTNQDKTVEDQTKEGEPKFKPKDSTIHHSPVEKADNLTSSLKTKFSEASPITKELSSLPATESSDIYEQHKQRLEKMLQSVTPTEVNSLQETTPAFENLKNEVLGKATTETDLDTQELEYLAPPPLSSEWLENGRPNWAQDRFDILIIEVNGLRLAVPLIALGQIQELDDKLTPLFGQSDWFMGLQQTPISQVKTVDTTKFVMPERYEEDNHYHYVISINGLSWGLAVDSIDQPISIDPDAIRWRSKRDSRPWMAGMVKDHMCVLIDIPKMGEILETEDKNHSKTTGG